MFDEEDIEVDDELCVTVTVIDGAGYTLANARRAAVLLGCIVT